MDWLTKQKTYLWLVILLVIINLTTLIFLWVGRPNPPEMNDRKRPDTNKFLKNELCLNEEQDKKLKELRKELIDSTSKLNENIWSKKQEIQYESFSENPDIEKVNSLSRQIGEIETQLEIFRFNHFAEVKKVLTSEQAIKFKNILAENGKHIPSPFDGKKEGPPLPPPDGFPPPER